MVTGNVVLRMRNGRPSAVIVGNVKMRGVISVETIEERAGNNTVTIRLHGRLVEREIVRSDEEKVRLDEGRDFVRVM